MHLRNSEKKGYEREKSKLSKAEGKGEVQYIPTVCGWEGVGGVLSPVGDHILQEFDTLYLTRVRTYKIPRPSQNKKKLRGEGASDR